MLASAMGSMLTENLIFLTCAEAREVRSKRMRDLYSIAKPMKTAVEHQGEC